MEKKGFRYGKLFRIMFTLSAFTFGGGYVIISMMRKKFVEELGWMDEQCLMDLVAIGQAAPGPIAINASILVGYHLGGFRGFLCSVIGTTLPPLITLSVVSYAYDAFRTNPLVGAVLKTMQAAIAAIIVDVVIGLGEKVVRQKSLLSILLMVGAFAATYFLGVNIAIIILICGVIGAGRVLLARKEGT